MNSTAEGVMTALTSAFLLTNSPTRKEDLYAAIPPATSEIIFFPEKISLCIYFKD
jgi:hypothetical protein